MSSDNHQPQRQPIPTESEIEALLSKTRPRPTARLNQIMRQAPWRTEEQGTKMTYIKRLDFIGTAAALLLLIIVGAVIISQWPSTEDSNIAAPISTRPSQTAVTATPVEGANTPAPQPSMPAATPIARPHIFESTIASAEGSQERDGFSKLAYGGDGPNGRLYQANGSQGIQIFDAQSGQTLPPIPIADPDTGLPVFVRDIAWGPFFLTGSETEGLYVLTDSFQNGSYLHLVDPETGQIVKSFQANNNIAIDSTAELLSQSIPTHLAVTRNGELYVDRVYTFAPEEEGQSMTVFHYILRLMSEGRILNSMLVYQGPTDEALPSVIGDLQIKSGTEQLFAAVRQDNGGVIQAYSLIGAPRLLGTFEGQGFQWQKRAALSSDDQGHIYLFLDGPARLIKLDKDDSVVAEYGFWDGSGIAQNTAVTRWFSTPTAHMLSMIVSPDATTLYLLSQTRDSHSLTAYALAE